MCQDDTGAVYKTYRTVGEPNHICASLGDTGIVIDCLQVDAVQYHLSRQVRIAK